MQTPKLFTLKTFIGIVALVLLANWFFTFQLVCLKDDNSFYYIPVRMYLSDALHHGTLPYWNSYMMGGVPQISDMQGATWNPITLILAYCFHYNHTCFLAEYLLYMLIAAIGMYKLTSLITKDKQWLLIAVVVYTCCGFASGIANFINWTASLAFIPWFLFYSYGLANKPSLKKALWLGIISWLSVVCGYPEFVILSVYLMAVVVIWQWVQLYKMGDKHISKISLLYFLLAVIVCFILLLPAITAYIEFFPFYGRGHELSTNEAAYLDCFYPQFFSSLFVPSSVYNKTFYVICHSANRDIYFGIIPLLLTVSFFANYSKHNKNIVRLFTGVAIFIFIFLFGYLTPLGSFLYNHFPLMGTFKWSAAARIFLIVLFAFAAIVEVQRMFATSLNKKDLLLIKITTVALIVGAIIVFFYFYNYIAFETPTNKNIFCLNFGVQLLLLLSILCFTNKIFSNKKLLIAITIADLFINYSIAMAATGVGNVKPAVFNTYAKTFYQQNPDNYLSDSPLYKNRALYMFDPWHNNNASKIINCATFLESNTLFSKYQKMFVSDTTNDPILCNNAFAFSNDVQILNIKNIHLTYDTIHVEVDCSNDGNIIIQQNNYFRWKEIHELPISSWKDCFITLPVKQGDNTITLVYDKGNYKLLFIVSTSFLLILLSFLFFYRPQKVLSTQRQP